MMVSLELSDAGDSAIAPLEGTGLRSISRGLKRGRWRQAALSVLVGTVSIAAWVALWQVASMQRWSFFFRFENIPAPSDVAVAFLDLFGSPKFTAHVLHSLLRIFYGFTIAAILAISVGLLVGRFRWAAQSLLPPLEVVRPIPAVAWIPIAILLFASAEQSMVFITFIGAFFPILLSTVHGVEALDRRLLHASLTLG
ncbi:MAG TPA: ABC transporter permease, partial [Polyangiaceae bacterium]|nr:ABC transporter permease [Polyangiaceae bacterium]